MTQYNVAVLSRDVDALLIPSGARIILHEGTEVIITQELGNSYTVNVYGNLARINGRDADALGKEANTASAEMPEDASIEDLIWAQLKTCYDPEIPVNIVDLGLIYGCEVKPLTENQYDVNIKMTLTAPACGMGPVLVEDVKHKVTSVSSVHEVQVELVFDPPWDRSMMSDAAKLEMGIFY